ncbi:MAG: glycosyltransferase family 4 protein [Nitrospirota bacterium]
MRIAIVRKKYVFHGGSETFSHAFIERLAENGHEVHIFAIKWETPGALRNIYFHRIPAIRINSFLRDLSFAVSSFLILRKRRKFFDIIQSHDKTIYQDIYRAGDGCHIEWLKQRWKRKGILGRISVLLNPYHWLILLLERMIFEGHRFKKVIAISKLVKKNILDHYNVNEKDIEVIYNAVDIERFRPENKRLYRGEIRKKYSIRDDAFVLLFVGSGFERKGVEHLLKAVQMVVYPLTVLIVGKGPEQKFTHPLSNHRIIFCGAQKEVDKYYAASDLFVFPALYEPFGNVHLEALATGLPVITTKSTGAAEILEDGVHGFVVSSPEDHASVAEKIELMITDSRQRELMNLNARKLAGEFSFSRYSGQILDLYRRVIQN